MTPALGITEAGAARRGTLLVIGDSLTVGASSLGGFSPRLRALSTWDEVVVDARIGRSARAGAAVLSRRLDEIDNVEAIVIALGTNDMAGYRDMVYARSVIDALMARSQDLPVLWINLEFASTPRPDRRSRGERFNAQLIRATTRWPNLVVGDWNTRFTPRTSTRFVADGMHLTTAAYRLRARFMIDEIGRLINWIETGGTTTSTTTTTVPPVATTSTSLITTTSGAPLSSTSTTAPATSLPATSTPAIAISTTVAP